jgi:hypothetical protein
MFEKALDVLFLLHAYQELNPRYLGCRLLLPSLISHSYIHTISSMASIGSRICFPSSLPRLPPTPVGSLSLPIGYGRAALTLFSVR